MNLEQIINECRAEMQKIMCELDKQQEIRNKLLDELIEANKEAEKTKNSLDEVSNILYAF